MRVHFLGIAGSGASAAAAIAQTQGFEITGCDLELDNEFTKAFDKNELFSGHSPKHLENIDILAVTPAIYSLNPKNPELLEAKRNNIPVLTWQQFTGEYLTKDKFVIAVCGTHGKTTTTAMIAQILEDAKLDPTVLIGAIVPKWGTNYRTGKGKYFVVEADEFNDNFLSLNPDISVVTNIEMDHPEYFKDFAIYKESFKKFLLQTKGVVVANLSDPTISQMYHDRDTFVTYLDYAKNKLIFPLKVPGDFNKLNAQAAFQVGLLLNINTKTIKQSLQSYTGVGRRFEYLGEFKGAKVYSDFGHHPTEIKETMQAVREKFPDKKIWLIYQPHMFTRTKALFDDFVKVFKNLPADKISIIDIYPSREVDTGTVSSKQLAEAIHYDRLEYHSKEGLMDIFKNKAQDFDVIFFMGAGDIDYLARELIT